MKKVLYVATIDAHIKSFHLPYLKLLKEMGYEVHVATNGDETFPNCDKKYQICVERNPFKLNNIKAIKQLKKIINEEKYDMIHCHTPMGSVVTRLAAKKARKNYKTRVIYTAHGFHFYKGAPIVNWLMYYPIEKILSKYTDDLITINKEDYNLAKSKFKTNIYYVPGVGIDESKFNFEMTPKEKQELRKSLGLKKDDFVMTYVARLDKNKNQLFLIEVMVQIVKKYKNIHLLLIGKDELNGYYQKKCSEKGLNNNIHFLGFREDIPKILKIANIAVAPSIREGLGLNLIESICCDLFVVASKNRGHNDIIKENINGYQYDTKKEFINIIKKIYAYHKNKPDISTIQHFYLKNTIKEVKKIYNNVSQKNNVPLRVLHIINSLNMGGAENFILNIYKNINREEIQFDFLVHEKGALDNIAVELGAKIHYIDGYINKQGPIKYSKCLKKFIQENNKYAVIHSHVDHTSGFIIPIIKKYSKAYCISHSHCMSNSSNFLIKIYKKYLAYKLNKTCDLRLACSKEAGKWLFGKNEFIVVNNPIDFTKFKFNKQIRKKLRKEFNILENEVVIGHVGRFVDVKNHNFLIDLYYKYNKKNDAKLFLIGEGPLKNNIINKINNYNLNDKVTILSNIYNIYDYYNIFDIFVFPSFNEGLGIVLLEAQANGLPVLTSSSIPKNVKISKNLEFIDLSDPEEWLRKIEKTNIKRNYNGLDIEEFKIEKITKLLEKEYKRGAQLFYEKR